MPSMDWMAHISSMLAHWLQACDIEASWDNTLASWVTYDNDKVTQKHNALYNAWWAMGIMSWSITLRWYWKRHNDAAVLRLTQIRYLMVGTRVWCLVRGDEESWVQCPGSLLHQEESLGKAWNHSNNKTNAWAGCIGVDARETHKHAGWHAQEACSRLPRHAISSWYVDWCKR